MVKRPVCMIFHCNSTTLWKQRHLVVAVSNQTTRASATVIMYHIILKCQDFLKQYVKYLQKNTKRHPLAICGQVHAAVAGKLKCVDGPDAAHGPHLVHSWSITYKHLLYYLPRPKNNYCYLLFLSSCWAQRLQSDLVNRLCPVPRPTRHRYSPARFCTTCSSWKNPNTASITTRNALTTDSNG